MPCHAVRREWNQRALHKHCFENDRQLFVVPAEHRTTRRSLTSAELDAVRVRSHNPKTENNKPLSMLELAIGMPVLITQNLRTEFDITNGARGTLVNIILNHAEPIPSQSQQTVNLKFPPRIHIG
ncbi:hypothetical protein J3R83DRAFT_8927 [Lanmaoa asiatica]|nr:hypothetical protein J3R83DRAFT_8927 [Lanmaoa asiatica]